MVAINDLWIIGDTFIIKNYFMLPKMKIEAVNDRRPLPYIYDFFNISCLSPNPLSLTNNVIARMVNCLIKALNDAMKVARLI